MDESASKVSVNVRVVKDIYIYIYIYIYVCVCIYIYIYIYMRVRNDSSVEFIRVLFFSSLNIEVNLAIS